MTKILSIQEMMELANPIIEIPGFNNGETINVKVKKPSIMSMFADGKVPNHLLGVASIMVGGKKSNNKKQTEQEQAKDLIDLIELYCQVCLVEPSYEEFKDIITDEQKEAILHWGMGDIAKATTFRDEKEIQSSNNDGETLPKEA